jgi:hypothetical protein
MAFIRGANAFIRIDGVAGSPVNVSMYSDDFNWPQTVDTAEVSTFGSTAKAFITTLTDGDTVSQSGPYDVAMGTFLSTIKAAQTAGSSTATLEYSPGGSVAGQPKISAEAWLVGYNPSSPVGGRNEYSASWQLTGAVTNSTW